MAEAIPLQSNEKILIVGPAWVGDMVMAQSLFRHIKSIAPNCTIDVLAPNWTSALLDRMPEVSSAIDMPLGHGVLDIKARYKLGKELANQNYTSTFVLPNSFKSALIPFFAGIKNRYGWRGEQRFLVLNKQRKLNKKLYPLMVQRFVGLAYQDLPLPDILLPKLAVDLQSQTESKNKFNIDATQPILALCPGAEFGTSKMYPAKHYSVIAAAKIREGYKVIIFGSKNDKAQAREIMQLTDNKCLDLTGATSLAEAIDLLALSKIVITNDSGLMHIACALDRKVVAIYGSTSTKFTPPLGASSKICKQDVACAPCFKRECPLQHHNCMQQLNPEVILKACEA